MAAQFNNDVTRAKMLIVADDYDKMAQTAAAIEASQCDDGGRRRQ